MIQARFEMDEYTVRVLDVIKGKFGLKNRDEALKKLALEAGNEYVELAPNEMVLKELDAMYESHMKKHPNRKMTDSELKKLLGL
ncbi:MAG TPA: hypothetical protein VJH97_01390 [Candidatus Nanoarchaeia archaeon]|nr:hypothetical protein [Candidatus Nanoarchaeia archaeon]